MITKFGNLQRSIYMEFKVISLKTTTLHSGVVMKRINLSL